jgi:type IV secretory pathway VirJ component
MVRNSIILTVGILIFTILKIPAVEARDGIAGGFSQTDHPDEDEMPLTIIPAQGNIQGPAFFIISGDGGWTSFDNSFCELLAKKGIPVVGIDAKKYFWKAKTPEETTAALASIIENYTKEWNRTSIVIAGYSFGADLIPFIANRLTEPLRSRISLILLLSPDRYGDFEIHLTDMLSLGIAKKKYNIVNEVKTITTPQIVSIFGQEEDTANIQAFREAGSKINILPGDHHYNKNVTGLAEAILKSIESSKIPQQ